MQVLSIKRNVFILVFLFFLFLFSAAPAVDATSAAGKRPLTHEDYDSWKTINSPTISPDGNWLCYIELPQDGEAHLVIKNLAAPQAGEQAAMREYRQPIGYSGEGTEADKAAKATFSYDSATVVFLVSPTEKEIEENKKAEKKKTGSKKEKPGELKKKLAILRLADGELTTIERVKSFSMPEKMGGWLAYLKEAPQKKKTKKDSESQETGAAESEAKTVKEKKETKPSTEKPAKTEKAAEKKDKEAKKNKKAGTDLVLRSLSDGKEILFKDVLSYYFSKDGKYFYFIVSSKENPSSDGVYRYLPGSGASTATPLLAGEGNYKHFTINKEQAVLAFLTDRDYRKSTEKNSQQENTGQEGKNSDPGETTGTDAGKDKVEPEIFSLYGCRLSASSAQLWVSHQATRNFPQGLVVSDKTPLVFSDNGDVVMFGIKEKPLAKKKDDTDSKDKKKAKFDLWHWKDPYPQPQQKKIAQEIRDNTYESVYFIKSKKFVRLEAEKDLLEVKLNPAGKVAFAQDNIPYGRLLAYDWLYNDVYVFDTRSGKKTLAVKKVYDEAMISPNGKYIFWYEDKNWLIYDIAKNRTINVTRNLGDAKFYAHDWDMPCPPGSYGHMGWTKDDKSILINDRYDIWEIFPDGSRARMITEGYGRRNHLIFRYKKLDKEETTIDPNQPLLFKVTNEDTMATGFYRDQVNGKNPPVKLIMDDCLFGILEKAKKSDRLIFYRSTFEEYPDTWTCSLDFKNPRKVTNLGRQTDPFIWGKAEMRSFLSDDGKPLKGILIRPENFDPKKKYPLMIYIYETLHQRACHGFFHPKPSSLIIPSYYVSNGYIIWLPDIEYNTGYPGQDALKCVLPGIQLLINEGFVDPKRIGIQGHSWGGYQIAYMVTQTDIFAAAEAGAPVSNMTSAYGGIRWQSGMVRQFQYERTQSRLGDSLWKAPLRYIENSPLFWADRVQTPLLMMHNDNDGAVPWYQGIEYMMALRRLDKEAYLFNYNGAGHGLRKRVNLVHWTKCMAEFFNHYLKGEPAPAWMTNGIKAWEKEEEKEKKK